MARVTISDEILTDVADAIRTKKSSQAQLSPVDFADEILSIPSGITLPNNMFMGTFVVTARTQTQQVIPHGLGSDITYAMIFIDEAYESGPAYTVIGGATVFDLNSGTEAIGTPSASYAFAYNGVRRSVNAAYANVHFDDTNIYIEGTGSYYLDPGYTYRVLAWAATTT